VKIRLIKFLSFKKLKIIPMKFSQRTLLKLKNKNKKLKPNKYKKLKREALRGRIKGTLNVQDYQFIVQMKIFMHKSLMIRIQKH
jgi:hypothetical protein